MTTASAFVGQSIAPHPDMTSRFVKLACVMIPNCALACLCNPEVLDDRIAAESPGFLRQWHVVAKTLEKYDEIVVKKP